jgi:ribosomal-protein-alanine N-acetyltransferase
MADSQQMASKRLVYRVLTSTDQDVVFRQFSDEDMCRFFSEPPCSWQEAADIITHYGSPDANKRYARWGMFRAEDGAFVGTCGYHYYDAALGQVEVGYDVWKEYWRQGYGAESVQTLVTYIWANLAVQKIYVLIDPHNVASIQLATSLGFRESVQLREATDGPFVCLVLDR